MDVEIKVQRCSHANGAEIRGSMRSSSHLIQLGKARDLAQVSNAARMNHGRADEIDELLLDELLAIVNCGENFPHGESRSGMPPTPPHTFLQFRRSWIL